MKTQTKVGEILYDTPLYIIKDKNGNTHAYADLANWSVMSEVMNIDDRLIPFDLGGKDVSQPVNFKNGNTGTVVFVSTLYMIKDKKGNVYPYASLDNWSVDDVRDLDDYDYRINW